MAQKINPISYRLGVKNRWRSNWFEKSKNFTNLLFQDLEVKHYTKNFLDSINVVFNDFIYKRTNKNLLVYSKNTVDSVFNNSNLSTFRRSKRLKKKISNSKLLTSLNHQGNYVLNVQPKNKFLRNLSNQLFYFHFSRVSAAVFASFFVNQIGLSLKMRNKIFKQFGLYKGILFTLRQYFKGKNKLLIRGIKVSLSGKWSKTKSGRKQKLIVSLGRLNAQEMNSFTDYDFKTVATKFGACSIKVFISYKSTKLRF